MSYIFAAVPFAPSSAPADDALVTSQTQIKVDYQVIDQLSETGGSYILAYNLQMDDSAGNFTDVSDNTLAL